MKRFFCVCLFLVVLSLGSVSMCLGQASEPPNGFPTINTADPAMLARIHDRIVRLDAAIKLANAALTAKQYDKAVSLFKKALVIWRDDEALLGLAEAYEKQNRQEQALQVYYQLAHPGQYERSGTIGADPTTRMRYVLLLLQNNRWQEAVDAYKTAIDPRNPMLNRYFVETAGQFVAERPEPDRMEALAHLLLGRIRPGHKQRNVDEDVVHLKQAARLLPGEATVRLYLADGLREGGHLADAKSEYRTTAILASNEPEIKALANEGYRNIPSTNSAAKGEKTLKR